MHIEPIFAVPNLICGTCRMQLQHMRPVSLRGVLVVRFPCDSCKNQGDVTVSVPETNVMRLSPQDGSTK